MKFRKRIASIAVAAALSIAGLTAVTLTAGHDGHWGQSAWAGDKDGKPMCDRGHGGKHGKYERHEKRHGSKGSDYLAEKLNVIETKIGIRADQLDVWRDFTDALQATMKRSMHSSGSGADAEPFSLAEGFADRSIERAKNAEALKKSIATLRTTLSAEQLDKVKEIESEIRSRMAMHHGWSRGHHGKGPHAGGSHGKHSKGMSKGMGMGMGAQPQAAPESGTDDAPDSDDDS